MKKIGLLILLIFTGVIVNAQVTYDGVGAKTTGGVTDWNDASNTKSGSGHTLLRGNATNGPALGSGNYFHPFNFEYSSRNGNGNVTQLAVPYGTEASINLGMMMRGRYSGTWSPWVKILSENTNGNVGIGIDNPLEKFQISNSYVFHDGGHKVLGFLYKPSGAVDLNSEKYAAEIRFDPENGTLGFGTSSLKTNTPSAKLIINKEGEVGIGTPTPKAILHASKNSNTDYTAIIQNGGGNGKGLNIRAGSVGTSQINASFRVSSWDDTMEKFWVGNDGNVGIGTTDTKGFKLGVNGKIAATEVKVAEYANWPDFVFKADYNLPTLQEVENHINEKGHLKNIPSEKEVLENGVFLGEMDAKLLQKIEELTLYTIQQEKKLEKQDKALKASEKANKKLEDRLSRLEHLFEQSHKN